MIQRLKLIINKDLKSVNIYKNCTPEGNIYLTTRYSTIIKIIYLPVMITEK
jgi:hypothetical protein